MLHPIYYHHVHVIVQRTKVSFNFLSFSFYIKNTEYTQWYILKYRILLSNFEPIYIFEVKYRLQRARKLLSKVIYRLQRARILLLKVIYGLKNGPRLEVIYGILKGTTGQIYIA